MEIMIRKSQPTPSDVHVNAPLTNISIAFLQSADAFIADQVFPNIPVGKQSDRYYTYDRGMFNRDEMAKRAPGTESAGVEYTVDNTPTYYCDVWSLHHDIPDERRANADSVIRPDREATELLTHKNLIKKESEFVSTFFTTSVWTTDVAGVAATPTAAQFIFWSDGTNGTPIEDIEAAKIVVGASTGFEPNTLVLGREAWSTLKNHPDIVDRIKYGQTAPGPAIVSLNTVAQVFELDRILVSRSISNTAAEGVANVHAYIAGDNALLCYVTPTPGLMTPSAGYTFSWNGFLGAAAAGQRMSKMRVPLKKADRVEIEAAWDQKVIAADLGYFFSNVSA